MDFEKFGITQTNITTVYEGLDLEALDRNALRRDLVEGVAPVVTEIPNVPSSRLSPSFETYMQLVNSWASAFDEEAAAYATEDIESLYDDAYFEALELQRRLP